MSVAAVLAAVETKCQGISGISVSTSQGTPEPLPILRAPTCVIDVSTPVFDRLSGGTVGGLEMRYTVSITLLLGGPEMQPKRALAAALPFIARFRDAFWGDPTLGGTCWRSKLSDGVVNLRDYRANEAPPHIEWRLIVRELLAIDGVSTAPGFVFGAVGYCGIGTAGSETDIAKYLTAVGYSEYSEEWDTTPYGATAASAVPGLSKSYVQLYGKWDGTLNALLAGLRRVTGKSIVLGPAGSSTGKVKISATGYLRDYWVDLDHRDDNPVAWRALFRATSAVTHGVF